MTNSEARKRAQAAAPPQCHHSWQWVSPAGTNHSARLCVFCSQPNPEWLDEVHGQGPQNIPTGIYRNQVGAELTVGQFAMEVGHCRTLGGDISFAEQECYPDGPSWHWLVTARSLAEAGYEKVGELPGDER